LAQEATLVIRTSYQNLIPGHRREFHKIIKEGLSRGAYKIILTRTSHEHPRRTFIQAPIQSIFKIFMQGPLEEGCDRISTGSSHKDLYKIMQGPLTGFH
jgi:hypothetical protein